MRKLLSKKSRKKHPTRREYIVYSSLVIVGVFFAAGGLRVLIGGFVEEADARSEYDQLREDFPIIAAQTPPPEIIDETPIPLQSNEEDEEEKQAIEEAQYARSLSLAELYAINRDFIGWMTVGNTIDYPVVRGADNNKYINTTFTGARNTAGAIFMDYRNQNGFDEQVCIIYGHYTRDGSMFSPLSNYLDPAYLQRNPNISITTKDGTKLNYKVFAATLTDAWDIAYTVGISESASASEVFPDVPENAGRFLMLSTCTRSADENERIIVYAAAS